MLIDYRPHYALAADLPPGVEGLAAPERRAFGVQYHPEAAPGPHDAADLFARFMARDGGVACPRRRHRPF